MVSRTYFPGSDITIKMKNINYLRNQQHYEETNEEY